MSGGIKKSGSSLPRDFGISVSARGSYLLGTLVTDPGYGYLLGIDVADERLDVSNRFGIFYEQVWQFAKLFPGGGTGTSSKFSTNSFGFGVKIFRKTEDVYKWGAVSTISEKKLSFGWQNLGSGRELGGESYTESVSKKRPVMYIGGANGYGLRIFLSGRFFIEPFFLFESGTNIPLTSKGEMGSPLNFKIIVGSSLGYGGANDEPGKERPPTGIDNARSFADDALDFLQRILQFRQDRLIAEGNSLLEESELAGGGGGKANPSMEPLSALRLLQAVSSGAGIGGFVEAMNASYRSGDKVVFGTRVVARALTGLISTIGGFAVGRKEGGEVPVADGVVDLAKAIGSLLLTAEIDDQWQLLLEGIFAAALQVSGTFLDNKGLNVGGMRWMTGLALSPDQRQSKLVKGKSVVAGYEGTLKGKGKGKGNYGTFVAFKNYLDVAKESFPEEDEGFSTTAIVNVNVLGSVENIATNGERYDVKADEMTILRTGIGVKKKVKFSDKVGVGFLAEVYTAQQFSGNMSAGGGAAGGIDLSVDITDSVALSAEAIIGVEKIIGESMRVYFSVGGGIKW